MRRWFRLCSTETSDLSAADGGPTTVNPRLDADVASVPPLLALPSELLVHVLDPSDDSVLTSVGNAGAQDAVDALSS